MYGIFPGVKTNRIPGDEVFCPCCGTVGRSGVLESVSYEEIWALLKSDWGAQFSDDVIRRHTPRERSSLCECGDCGLQFFLPSVGGDEDFYRELGESPRYYNPWKWEFGWSKDRIPPSAAVLDVGCGRGDFLLFLSGHGRRVVGLERNPSARESAAARGLSVSGANIEEFSKENREAFDVICAFHVVEHLPAPVPFLQELLACLRPGGTLFLSMPNRLRSSKALLEPLDCPPHHLTRWEPETLQRLGDVLEVPLREIAFEPVEISVPWGDLREWIRVNSERMPAGKILGALCPRIVPRLVFFPPFVALYRRFGLLERRGYYGLSMAARFARHVS